MRWVLIGLSIRLGIAIEVVEAWDAVTLREYMAVLSEMAEPAERRRVNRTQTPEEIMANFSSALGGPSKARGS